MMGGQRFSTAEDVLSFLENEGSDVRFINLLFPDILGELRGFDIPSYELEQAFEDGTGFDGSSIEGLARIEESDLLARPDPASFRVLPWRYEANGDTYRVGCLFCDIHNPDGSPNRCDTRFVLKHTLRQAREQGFSSFKIGPEPEFFYLENHHGTAVLDKGDYFSMGIGDPYGALRKETALGLLDMDIVTEYGHHEVAPSQHEIDLRYGDALDMADIVMLFRYVVKEYASRANRYATFMPKPLDNENGNGMHVHQSLWNEKGNVFYSDSNPYNLSDIARAYTAGILAYIGEITAVLNQWVNSYKRLVPGYEAPVYIVWGQKNRSALVRIPEYAPGKRQATRIELRSPDPGCNPYLAFSVMLAVGLRGIQEGLELPSPTEQDIYCMDDEERKRLHIDMLPGTLEEALAAMQQGTIVRETFGEQLYRKFIANKEIQLRNYRGEVGHKYDARVSPFEIEHNLPRL
jgi:glutamine synthetase